MKESSSEGTFWDHLEVLRGALLRSIIAVCAVAAAAFAMKDFMFGTVIFGPASEDFPLYGILREASLWLGGGSVDIEPVKIINTQLPAQLLTHLSVSLWAGFIVCVPYIAGELWFFVRPALYPAEKSGVLKAMTLGGLLFYMGVLAAYFLILPLSVNFLASYKVMDSVENLIDLSSYIDTLVSVCLSTGAAFEMPVAAYFAARTGLLSPRIMRKYRSHAFLAVLTIAAMITPSTDVITMLITALPLQLIYEISILAAARAWAARERSAAA